LGQPCTVNRPYGGLCSQRPVTPDQQLPLPPPQSNSPASGDWEHHRHQLSTIS
jgi:hypothetical protein